MSHDFTSAPYSPAPSSFSVSSMADPNVQQRQPPVNGSYPSPHSYPSPSMQASYTYPPPQGSDAYRGSPQGAHNALPPLNLPPIRQLDGQPPQPQPQQQQQHHQQQAQQPMGSPLPPPHNGQPQYYPHQGHAPPGQMGMANMGPAQYNASMRYQLPPQHDQRQLSGGRHKKEIKRRTKTGCLTCRKRRIKCDEAHPACRNCQKSKRECLGYDPIFKQQPGPAQIQPAPNSHSHSSPDPTPATGLPSEYSQSPVPQGYAPASSSAYPPAASATSGVPENFNAIDPALAAPSQGTHAQPPYMDPNMRGPPSGQPYTHPQPPPQLAPSRGKRLNITEIFGICNHSPPQVPHRTAADISPELTDAFSRIFYNDYCQGLDVMLQTTWFGTNNNAMLRVLADPALHAEAAYFSETMQANSAETSHASVFSQEARLIWHLLGTCKHPTPNHNGVHGSVPDYSDEGNIPLKEARARFDVLEALVTNQNLPSNPLRQIPYPAEQLDAKRAEIDFWLYLGDFVQYSGADNPPQGAADFALNAMRGVLHVQEVRDAIYSIAIARHYGSRVGGFPNALPQPVTQQEDDDLSKLHVAMSFISHESRSGSQQVLARICDMAMLSWAVARSP